MALSGAERVALLRDLSGRESGSSVHSEWHSVALSGSNLLPASMKARRGLERRESRNGPRPESAAARRET